MKCLVFDTLYDPHPHPLSQRERGEKPQEFPFSPSPFRRGG